MGEEQMVEQHHHVVEKLVVEVVEVGVVTKCDKKIIIFIDKDYLTVETIAFIQSLKVL